MDKLQMPTSLLKRIQERLGTDTDLTSQDYEQYKTDSINAVQGGLTGFDCAECKNRGYIASVSNGQLVIRDCGCRETRRALNRIKASGLEQLIKDYTFANYTATEEWQIRAKEKATLYLTDNYGKWFLMAGSVGSGKTHLCTAICGEFLRHNKNVRYMLWRDDSVKIKAAVTDDYEYATLINPLKTCEVLYIDDLFKGGKPTDGDIKLAFEILNYRYNDRDLKTLISTERTIDELLQIDEATGSRIYQRSKDYCIALSGSKNYRLKG